MVKEGLLYLSLTKINSVGTICSLLPEGEKGADRAKGRFSQAVMAKILNVTSSTYQKWERGEVHPKGANLKRLRLAYDHGIEYMMS